MEIIQILINIIVGFMAFYMGTVEKRISSMQAKLDSTPTKEDVKDIITLELKSIINESSNQKEDLKRIEDKIDKLVDKILKTS